MSGPARGCRTGAPLRFCLALVAFLVVLVPWWTARHDAEGAFPGFVVTPAPSVTETRPFFRTMEINPQSPERKAHSSTLAELPDGTLAAAWYAGSGEGARDVTIQMATQAGDGVWSAPRVIFGRERVAESMRRFVLSLGNPLLFTDEKGRLGLLFVSIAAGKWSGSSMNLAWSSDAGRTWTNPEKLTLNPLANLSALPRNPPVPLVGGGWAVPIYEEFLGRFPELLWIRPRDPAALAAVSRMDDGMSVFQPAVVALSPERGLAFYRDDSGTGRVFLASSADCGRTWGERQPSDLPNVDSGMCALRLPDGRLLCAVNDSPNRKRENLRLALSSDGGQTWRYIATLAEERGENFDYPYMILGRDGRVRMLYSSRGRRIVYAEFNSAWIDSQVAGSREVRP
ncbi:MAG: sialidase family protein [Chthoniobacterales bacterium]